MKNIMSFVALCLLSVSLAQVVGRESSSSLPVVSPPIASLETGTGWVKDSFGEWHGNTKLLSPAISNGKDLGLSDFHRSKFDDYTTINLRDIAFQGNEYYALEKNHVMGAFQYEAIREDWYTYPVTNVCVFERPDLERLATAIGEEGVAQRVTLDCVYGPIIENASFAGEPIETLIAKRVALQERSETNHSDLYRISLDVFPVTYEGERLVRFLWRESGYAIPTTPFGRNIFNSRYYEASWDAFAQLVNP